MDGKVPDLGSSSAMLFCADNPVQGPTTPHSFCSSACMGPLTSSSSSTPDYAAAAKNLGGLIVCMFAHGRSCVCAFMLVKWIWVERVCMNPSVCACMYVAVG
eukprot:1159817-Pelagomonas_calceolata.AAC.2